MAATYVLLSHTSLGSNTSVVTINSIPSTYSTLILKCALRTAVGAVWDTVGVRFNGDNDGANYYTVGGGRSYTTSTNYFYQNLQGILGVNSASGDNLAAGTVGFFEMTIVNANTSQPKTIVARGGITNSSYTNETNLCYGGMWNIATAINSINVRSSSTGDLLTNSTISLYGLSNT